MIEEDDHRACVERWMERSTTGGSSERLLELFEHVFDALWRRAHRTLGAVTLTAIVDRVLYSAAEQHPVLAAVELNGSGVSWGALRERARGVPPTELAPAIHFVLEEFLTVIGKLTAEILTPALHGELARVAPPRAGANKPGAQESAPHGESNDGEGAKR
jgi:hypothetical protein